MTTCRHRRSSDPSRWTLHGCNKKVASDGSEDIGLLAADKAWELLLTFDGTPPHARRASYGRKAIDLSLGNSVTSRTAECIVEYVQQRA